MNSKRLSFCNNPPIWCHTLTPWRLLIATIQQFQTFTPWSPQSYLLQQSTKLLALVTITHAYMMLHVFCLWKQNKKILNCRKWVTYHYDHMFPNDIHIRLDSPKEITNRYCAFRHTNCIKASISSILAFNYTIIYTEILNILTN